MIVGAVMVPHPPLAVPSVGKGEEQKIAATVASFQEAAEFIARKRPDTIILASPHALMYRDYFNVAEGSGDTGSFARFGAPETEITVRYDREFTYELTSLLEEKEFPGGTEYDENNLLSEDHGTMVPLYFIQQKWNNFKLVRVGLSGLPLTMHYEMGRYLKEVSARLHRRVVFVASGDLSHCQKADGPYGYSPEGEEYDRRIMTDMGSADFGKLLEYDASFCRQAMECGHSSFVMMAGILDRTAVRAKTLSHENTFGVGYGVVLYEAGTEDPSRSYLEQHEQRPKDQYVKLAEQAIACLTMSGTLMPIPEDIPEEMKNRQAAVFVSIHKHGELRGCIGTIRPVRENIAMEIVHNAAGACSRDPRFLPVRPEELPDLEVSVDVLGEMEAVKDTQQLDVHRYGILVKSGERSGLLLPDLAGVDTVAQQIEVACRKGGIDPLESMDIFRFEVVRHV